MVRLVGDSWPPDRAPRELPGNAGTFGAGPGSVPAFTSFTFGAIELLNEPIPVPFAVTAEVAVTWVDPQAKTTCWGGIYAGGAAWDVGGRSFHALPTAVVFSESSKGDPSVVPYRAVFGSLWWAGDGKFTDLTLKELGRAEVRKAPGSEFAPDWHQFRIEVGPRTVGAAFGGATETVNWASGIARYGRTIFRGPPHNIADPHVPAEPGPGVGLVVHGAELRVRNVKLVPLTP
jgi:hypothetical protein